MQRTNVCARASVILIALSTVAPGTMAGAASGAAPVSAATALLGAWQDGHGDLLPPGVSHFEAISSSIVFESDGRFALTVDKAAGVLHESGSYTIKGQTVTLDFPSASVSYGFSRAENRLTLEQPGESAIGMRVL